jgi:hypothetical protein
MFSAVILVCVLAAETCDAANAVWSAHSNPIFADRDACFAGAVAFVHHVEMPRLVEGEDYRVEVTCNREDGA